MHNVRCLFAITAAIGIIVLPHTSWANPLAGSAVAIDPMPLVSDNLLQKVHGWHCSRKKGWYKGDKVWHRHRRACHESQYDDDDFYDEDYYVYRRRTSPGVYINPGASIRLHLGGQGDWD